MGKASKHKGTPAPPPARRPFGPAPRWASVTLIGASIAGFLLAAFSAWDHYQLTQGAAGYTSLCNLTESVNCEDVVTSSYGKLFGVPVSVWALGFYALLFLAAMRAREGRDVARSDALALVLGGALFSAYLAIVSAFVLKTLCPVCAGLYAVAIVVLVSGWAQASPFAAALAQWKLRAEGFRRRPVLASSGAFAAASLLILPGFFGAPRLLTREEIFRAEPSFYEWYTTRPIVEVPEGTGQSSGPEDAPLTIVEFSDYQCPHCQRAHVLMKDLVPRFKDRIRFVFHHYPLSNKCNPSMPTRGHRFACEAAIGAECAAEQGKFDAFSNMLFARQKDLSRSEIRKIARDVGLDLSVFADCENGDAAKRRVRADVQAGQRAEIASTPTFFVNGRRIDGNLSTERWLYAFGIELDGKK